MTLRELQETKDELEQALAKSNRLQGVYEENKRRLKEAGCASLEEAESLLAEKTAEKERLEKEIEQLSETFREKWGDLLD